VKKDDGRRSLDESALETPVHWYRVVNLKTAITLGIVIPSSIVARADEVIE